MPLTPDTPDTCAAFLDAHPDAQYFDLIVTPMSGVPRGKRLRRHEMPAVFSQGRFLPQSILVTDITGRDCAESGLIWEDGDADRIARPIPGTLVMTPWQGPDCAQVSCSMYELDGEPSALDPRAALQRVIDRFAADGLTPVLACELEYYLVEAGSERPDGPRMRPCATTGRRQTLNEVYGLAELHEIDDFLRDLYRACDMQGIPLEGAIAEYSPGQIELTLAHKPDALRACDDAILYKRAAKGVALNHGLEACFMAKPFAVAAGSGFHVHVSVNDAQGRNIFASEAADGSPALRHAIGGMRATLADTMAILAPNANSYRRFRSESYAPTTPTWGVNNRTVSLRIPAGSPASRHVEHRVAGADANPYLAVAAVLAGVHHGLTHGVSPGPPVSGNGYAAPADPAVALPTTWSNAIDRFAQSSFMQDYLGERFCQLYAILKRSELDRYNAHVPMIDYDWYLRNA